MQERYTEPKPKHGSQEWLTARWKNKEGYTRVTASVAAVVHNEHKYTTPADLAVELLSVTPPAPKEQNDAMRRGTILEEPLLRWASEILGKPITEPHVLYAYDEDGVRLLSTIDGMDPLGEVYELKTYNKRWQGQLPRYWYWQGVQQAICTDSHEINWIVFDSNLELHFHTQTVTSDEKQIHIDAVRRFLSFIDMGMMPEIADPTYDNAATLYPQGIENTVVLGHEIYDTLERLSLAREQKRQAEQLEEQLKGEIAMILQDCEYVSVDGTVVVSWKNSKRTSFDTKKFEAEHPALAAKFKKETTFRTMRIVAKESK